MNFHFCQPLLDNELLLVCSRSRAVAGGGELNGRVFDEDGKFKQAYHLGDGIESMQTTSEGMIWTSFFDEGVFGNSRTGADDKFNIIQRGSLAPPATCFGH